MIQKLISSAYLDALNHVIYPNMCAHCHAEIGRFESYLCHACWEATLPTYFEHYKETTALDQLFFGRTKLHSTYALFHFETENPIQSLLHVLKYNHREKVGHYLGQELGKKLKLKGFTQPVDAIVPVPIHPKKEFQRGYNQCDSICRGIAQALKTRIDKTLLRKTYNSTSQTRKSKWERWENSIDNFSIMENRMEYQHILLVDDVITTGATLESIINKLNRHYPDLKISVASVAFAGK
jgi:ComF family protein